MQMGKEENALHFVCTPDEAEELIKQHKEFWVSNCGCREQKGECRQSRKDVCLSFTEDFDGSGSDNKTVDRRFAEDLLTEAHKNGLVTRPFRDFATKSETQGICFCCQDCCGYFLNREEKCDKGAFIEETDHEYCTDCELCVDVCYFGARSLNDKEILEVDQDSCYGCGLCFQVCPVECIEMVNR